jgi:hypothetical protein
MSDIDEPIAPAKCKRPLIQPREAGYWAVWRVGSRFPKVKHPDEETALIEASRLAEQHPGKSYVVLLATEVFHTVKEA